MTISDYTLLGELKTTNSGFSKWGFARKGGRVFFIKEFIDPVYPVCVTLLTPEMLAHKRQICERYEHRSQLLYNAINACSDGNLVHIEEFFRSASHYYLVMEKVDAIGLDEVRHIPVEDKLRICKALVHCLERLHHSGIVHGDIKLDNILFRRLPSGKVTGKLIDFDNSFWESEPPKPDEEIYGDLVYMAPETFMMMQNEAGTIDRAIDVFALGIVFHQLFTGVLPAFDTEKYDYPFEAVVDGQKLGVSAGVPEQWQPLIARMLETRPDKRITLEAAEALLKGGAPQPARPAGNNGFFSPAGDL